MSEQPKRERPDSHRDQTRAAARARNKALRDLSHQFPDEYRVLYELHAVEEGVMPHGVRKRFLEQSA